MLAGGGPRQHGFQGAEMSDVAAVLLASLLVRAAGLRAHEGLRRASPIGDMGHVETVTIDGPVEVLAAVFSDAEPRHLGGRINSEGLQGAAILARARERHRLRPILWRFG